MKVHERTRHILGIEGLPGSSGDPSPLTAWGVYNGMKAAARHVYGDASLKGKRIAVQGLGYVSHTLVKYLVEEGASVVGTDVDAASVSRFQREFGIDVVGTDEILSQPCDILSPNALGAIINRDTIPHIKAKIVAGAANNQLATDEDGFELVRRGIVYAPDYAINAGGLINIYHERGGYNSARAYDHVAGIYRTIEEILARADRENLPPHRIADRIAEERVAAGPAALKG
jgi:leucine dehydrogenase